MKFFFAAINIIIFHTFCKGQVSIQTDLPLSIEVNKKVIFQVKISKGPLKNYSKYQLEVPKGMEVKEIDVRTGSFSFENNTVKIIWPITPVEPEFIIKMELFPGAMAGKRILRQKYFYLEMEKKKEISIAPLYLQVTDTVTGYDSTYVGSNTSPPADSLFSGQKPDELSQQVKQLKKDSKEAFEIGEKEKGIAELKLAQANEAILEAEKIYDPGKKASALEKARTDKLKAETDIAVAEKILLLAKTLGDNASEIEKLNTSITDLQGNSSPTLSPSAPVNSGSATIRQNAVQKDEVTEKPVEIYKKTDDPVKLKQQVAQLRKDAREAEQVGEHEKKKALLKQSEANKALKKAGAVKKEKERIAALEKAGVAKEKAEDEMEVANKILALASTLEASANELEHLHPDVFKASGSSPVNTLVVEPALLKDTTGSSEKDIDKLKGLFNENEAKSIESNKKSNSPSASDLVYMVQVGAFEKEPGKRSFSVFGKVTIKNENGLFKVLIGNYGSREEAVKKQTQIRSKGFDGFIVTYSNGNRVKLLSAE